jgi:Zn-dependent M28 family amino/carboxypeptidase
VIGYIPGKRDAYVFLSAHYDHLGIGPAIEGDSIYNGMSDNAVGTAALLEIARLLSIHRNKYLNSILILFTTGEEKGLLGSQYYCDHPVVPLYKTIANINIDGLAIFDQVNEIIGVGAELSDLEADLETVARQFGLNIGTIPTQYFEESQTLNRSDQFSFAKAGIPSILILEGLDYKTLTYQEGLSRIIEWNTKIYHTPFDDLSQEINFAAAEQHTNFILAFTEHLAQRKDPVNWKPGVPFITARLRTIAEKR